MQRLITLLCVFITVITFAQSPDISPHYPKVLISQRGETQFTYYDLNFVNTNIQFFVKSNMGMKLIDDPIFNLNDDGKGTIDYNYTENIVIGKRKPYNIIFSYTVEPIGHLLVITKCKITGSPIKVADFFIKYWKTDIQLEKVKQEKIIYNYYVQDKITYHVNKGNPFISIENTTIKDFKTFEKDYLEKVKEVSEKKELKEKELKEKEESKKTTIEEKTSNKTEEKDNRIYSIITDVTVIDIKKGKLNIFQTNISDDLSLEYENYLKGKKDGRYFIMVKITHKGDKKTNEFKLLRYSKK